MNSLPDDRIYRKFYDAFETDHDEHREALMGVICAEPPSPVHLPADAPARNRRRVLIGLVATIVLMASLPFLSNGFERKPATILEDGWRQELIVESDISAVGTDDDRKAVLELWTEEGWLIACRKSREGEVEWQVVLAKSEVAEAPQVVQTADDFTVTFGAYSIHDTSSGDLRIRRQYKKSNDQWPTLDLGPIKPMVAGNWWGVHLASQRVDKWAWIIGGPNDWKNGKRDDLWLRSEQTKMLNAGYGVSSGLLSLELSLGSRKATDDGRQFIASRATNTEIAEDAQNL